MVRAMVYAGLPNDYQVMAKYGVNTSEHGEIVMAVCIALGVEQKALYSRGRTRKLSEARQIAYYLLRELTSLTLKQVGEIFNRDHSTVIYGVDTCKDLIKVDIPFQRKLYRVKSLL